MNIIAMRQWLLGFVPGQVNVGYRERLRACVGALIGILITGSATRLLLGAALLYNNLTRHRYPHPVAHTHDKLHGTEDKPPGDRLGFTPADLDTVLKNYMRLFRP